MVSHILLGSWQSRKIFEIAQTELSLQDLAFDLDEVTELYDSRVFRLSEGELAPFKS